jgi:simple sugar transport system ATP-binding protein
MSTPPLISFQNVTKHFAGVTALDGVSFDISAGEVCCLLGENGSGKSTLIKTLSGVHAPDEGNILIDGKGVGAWAPADVLSAGIEVIYQDFLLFPNLTVVENICLLSQLSSHRRIVDWTGMTRRAVEVLDRMGVSIPLHARVEEISVAQRQLVAIARALLGRPRLIVMDEPTSALSAQEIARLLAIIEELRGDGVAVIFVSHKMDEVMRVAKHVVILRSGRKVFDGPAVELTRASIIAHMVGKEVEEDRLRAGHRGHAGEMVLELRNLTRARYFKNVSLSVRHGEILGVTGQIDSGRTALALALYGLLPPDSGEIRVEGKLVRLNRIRDALNVGIGLVPEDRLTEGVLLARSVGANLTAGIMARFGNVFGLLDRTRVAEFQRDWVARLAIKTDGTEVPVSSLSGGNQQRVVLARALARKPKVVVLNGPTVGVDIGSKAGIHAIIEELSATGVGVIVISDDTDELLRLSDRIVIMDCGRVRHELSGDAVNRQALSAIAVNG